MKKYILLFLLSLSLIVFLGGVELVSAEIKNPYVVDYKSPVLFGDSGEIGGYHGLENYTLDYVGGYAHITFTYTHVTTNQFCCFASYPPSLYVTGVDPRATSTPTVKLLRVIYHLIQHTHNPTHTTDWYFYDIQFDATGYTVVVKRAGTTEIANFHMGIDGLSDSDWVALANLYPINAVPEGTFNPYSMSFTPVTLRETVVPPELEVPDPVIIVPGIMGSAYKNDQLVIDPILHTYDDLIATLDENGYTPDIDLFTFPYEWRDSNVFTANLLDDKIEQVKSVCDCDKVDLVAHSMGGLVARAYIQSVDYDEDVDQIIFLGTPHKGAPTAYLQWEAGKFPTTFFDTLIELFFEAEALRKGYATVFNYIHNRPILSVQELLPAFSYLKDKGTGAIRIYPNSYPQNYFLENLNNNISNLLNSGVKITNIVSNSGSNTIEKIRVVEERR